MGIVELNHILNVNIGLEEFKYCYIPCLISYKDVKYYFKTKEQRRQLVQIFLDVEKGIDDIMAIVSGNWEYGDTPEVNRSL